MTTAPTYRFLESRGFRGRVVEVYVATIGGRAVEKLGRMGYRVDGKFGKTLAAATALAVAAEPIEFAMLVLRTATGSQVARDALRSDRNDARRLGVAA
jgi:hypothetical protein